MKHKQGGLAISQPKINKTPGQAISMLRDYSDEVLALTVILRQVIDKGYIGNKDLEKIINERLKNVEAFYNND